MLDAYWHFAMRRWKAMSQAFFSLSCLCFGKTSRGRIQIDHTTKPNIILFRYCWWCWLQSKCHFVPFRKRVRVYQKSHSFNEFLFISEVDNGILICLLLLSHLARNAKKATSFKLPLFYMYRVWVCWFEFSTASGTILQ